MNLYFSIPLLNMFALLLFALLTLVVILLLFLYLADSKLIAYSTQSSLISDHFAILFDLNLQVIQINRPSRLFRKISSIDKPMCVNSVFHKLNNSISSDLSTLFYYFNLALSHLLDICVPSITFINQTYYKFP